MKPDQDEGGLSGMSRAAKKRAKKKQKKEEQTHHSPPETDDTALEKKSKKAKKKNKEKKRPLEEEKSSKKSHHNDGKEHNNKPEGILKKAKYSNSDKNSAADKQHMSHVEDDADDDDNDNGISERLLEENNNLEMADVVLSEEMQEMIKSNQVVLKDILLLNDNKEDEKSSTKNRNNHKKTVLKTKGKKKKVEQEESEEDEEDEDDKDGNPFQTLTSKERARCALNFLLAPSDLTAEDFYDLYWEKKALCVQQKDSKDKNYRHRFDGFLSLKSIRDLTEKHTLYYGRDLNVTKYHTVQPGKPKRRANIDPPPFEDTKTGETKHVQVDSNFVWEQFDDKHATIRLLCPHKQNDSIHALLSLFELEWGCMVGANAYLTPAGASQGFGTSCNGRFGRFLCLIHSFS